MISLFCTRKILKISQKHEGQAQLLGMAMNFDLYINFGPKRQFLFFSDLIIMMIQIV